jgi:hypothetical protein
MSIMAVYIFFLVIGELIAYAIGRIVEQWSMAAGLPVFLAGFIVVFWLAWILAVRVTEPKRA